MLLRWSPDSRERPGDVAQRDRRLRRTAPVSSEHGQECLFQRDASITQDRSLWLSEGQGERADELKWTDPTAQRQVKAAVRVGGCSLSVSQAP
jgi:hypothetical protein